jgi:hypothetical protein
VINNNIKLEVDMAALYSLISISFLMSLIFTFSSHNETAIKICVICWIVIIAVLSILHVLKVVDMTGFFIDKGRI